MNFEFYPELSVLLRNDMFSAKWGLKDDCLTSCPNTTKYECYVFELASFEQF